MKLRNIIIFEGPDDTGKSNIARALSERIGVPYYKNEEEQNLINLEDTSLLINNQKYVVNLLDKLNASVIFDRFHVSEFVYSQLLGRKTQKEGIYKVDEMLDNIGAKIVYCYKDDLDDYEDDYISKDKVAKIKELYREFFDWNSCEVIKIKTDDRDLKRQVDEIIEKLIMKSGGE